MADVKRSLRSVLKVVEKAAKRFPTNSGALGPVIVITIEEADLPILASSGVSHLGCLVKASPVLKVVSSVAIISRVSPVGMPCTKSWVVGASKCTLTVPGIR